MPYRGSALTYKIRKTTTKNLTGDSFAITIPRIVAQQFENIFFRLSISGDNLLLTSGCKISVNDIEEKRNIIANGGVIFR